LTPPTVLKTPPANTVPPATATARGVVVSARNEVADPVEVSTAARPDRESGPTELKNPAR
jgi:hypothetical protein